MKVRLLLFGPLAEAVDGDELLLEIPSGARVADVVAAACERAPALAPYARSVAVAVDQQFAPRDRVVAEGEELALIPPVSGG